MGAVGSNINTLDKRLSYPEQLKYLQDTVGLTEEEAIDVANVIEFYSDTGYKAIKEASDDKLSNMSYNQMSEILNNYIENPNSPKYNGTLYRGFTIKQVNREQIDKMIEKGIWTEKGITSFSADKSVANSYSQPDSLSDRVLVKVTGSTSGTIIGNLSVGGGEKEVLYSSSKMSSGFKIVSAKKTPEYYNKFDRQHYRKTGERKFTKAILRYNYEITVKEK